LIRSVTTTFFPHPLHVSPNAIWRHYMPGNTTPLCKQQAITQISTGQAGEEVNADLESLFRTVNRIIRCQSAMADAVDQVTGGAFGSGDGGTGGGDNGATTIGGVGTGMSMPGGGGGFMAMRVSTGSAFTVPENFNGVIFLDATADLTVTLCPPREGQLIVLMNVGASHVLTVHDDLGNTIATTIEATGWMSLTTKEDSSNVLTWPSACPVVYPTGSIVMPGNIVWSDSAKGPVLKSPNGHLWLQSVSNAGVVTNSDLGTAVPGVV
jgi:hypothetical protein